MIQRINGSPVKEIMKIGKTWHPNSGKYGKMKLSTKKRKLITIAKRDGMNCCYCERPVKFAWMGDYSLAETATFEHKILKSLGGAFTVANGLIACHSCNENRADLPIEEFLTLMSEGYFVEDEVRFRRIANKARRAAIRTACYKVRVKKRARKATVVNTLKVVYSLFNPVLADAELG